MYFCIFFFFEKRKEKLPGFSEDEAVVGEGVPELEDCGVGVCASKINI